ncbi:hypothetical protein SOASR032_03850 [Pragia fontium]|uniref:DUF1318 domain-containing protein n=1 Tax=Pragia fontium TaxID=82985 RepID=A0ABQ5LDY1_9GAMM|nr:YdbL family protein [Pragia fontium]GKX61816.1 hypothetical protein SOASR032_03850 [Pragia fontium]
MKRMNVGLIVAALLFSSVAGALTLKEAKQQGLVGETLNGYIAAVQPTTEAQDLVKRINQARLEQYKSVAAQNNVSVGDVASMTGQKLINRAESGEYVKGINGQWLRK